MSINPTNLAMHINSYVFLSNSINRLQKSCFDTLGIIIIIIIIYSMLLISFSFREYYFVFTKKLVNKI